MYFLTKNIKEIDGREIVLYGVANENKDFGDFTDDVHKAKDFVGLLNKENAETMHVSDIIEDMFY